MSTILQLKKCNICNQELSFNNFGKHKKTKDGLCSTCKSCKKKQDQLYYELKKVEILNKRKDYYNNNKENILEKRNLKADELKEYNKEYRQKNTDLIKEYNKRYKHANRIEIKEQRKIYRSKNKEKINIYRKRVIKNNPNFAMAIRVRKRLNDFLTSKGLKKEMKFSEYLGCDKETLMKHIESQFEPGMNWDNRDEWHIDHIIPLGLAFSKERIYDLCHYKNLRPLWKNDNLKKNDNSGMAWQYLRRLMFEDSDKKDHPIIPNLNDLMYQHESLTKEHKEFIEKYEWLGTIGYGAKWAFTARYQGVLVGIVILSKPIKEQFGEHEAYIQRGAAASWAPKNLNSKLVMFALNWMVRNTDKRIFTAYADEEAGEIGTIYQACNFDYLGNDYGSSSNFMLPDGKVVTRQWFYDIKRIKIWSENMRITFSDEWVRTNGFLNYKALPIELKNYIKDRIKECPKIKKKPKHKYVLLLNYGKDKLKRSWVPLPYPKRKLI